MKLLTKAIEKKLVSNYEQNLVHILDDGNTDDLKPVMKLFNPCGAATWLITELEPDTNVMFGLCDLGMGTPELGSVSLDELQGYKGPFGLGIERDIHWEATKTLNEYATEARQQGTINV